MNEAVKMGFVGVGKFANMVLPAMDAHPDAVNVVRVADVNESARSRSRRKGIPTSKSAQLLLEREPNLEYLYLAVTPANLLTVLDEVANYLSTHNRQIALCLEKPMGYDFDEALQIYSLITQDVFKPATVFNRFSYPTFKYGLELLTQGAIGKLQRVDELIAISGPPPTLDGWVSKQAPEKHRGITLLNGFHSNSLFPLLLGFPKEVTAYICNTHSYPHTEVDDYYKGEVTVGNTTSHIENRWSAHDVVKLSTQLIAEKGSLFIQQWGKVGIAKNGKTVWQDPRNSAGPIQKRRGKKDSFEEKHAASHDEGIWGFHHAVIELIKNQIDLPHHVARSADIAMLSMLLTEAAYKSNENNSRSITLEEILNGRLSNIESIAALARLPGLHQ